MSATAPPGLGSIAVLGGVFLLLALSSAANFVLATAVTPHVADPALVVIGAAGTCLLLLLMGGVPRRDRFRALGLQGVALGLFAGALVGALAPALVATSRYSDSPPGSVVAFWTTAVTGALLVLAATLGDRRYVRLPAVLVGVVGAAGVLGNWERPSSFSLLVLHTTQEIALIAAGVAWVVAVVVARRLALRAGSAPVYSLIGIGGLLAAVGWALPASGWELESVIAPSSTFPAAISQALLTGLLFYLAIRVRPHIPGAALLLAVPLITGLLFVEEATGVFGPRPILVEPAGWSVVLMVAAALLVMIPAGRAVQVPRAVSVGGIVLATAACGVALVALALPGVEVAVRGTALAGAGFAADFALSSFRTVGGWIAAAVALLALLTALDREGSRLQALSSLLAALVAAAAYVHVRYTPLHVWMRWIPPEVQQDYGSEYATIVFTPVPTPVQVATLVLACAALALVTTGRLLAGRVETDASRPDAGGRDL